MRSKPYTAYQVAWLKTNAGRKNFKTLTNEFNVLFGENRTVKAISNMLYRSTDEYTNRYTEEELKFLYDRRNMNRRALAVMFNEEFGYTRSYDALRHKLNSITKKEGFMNKVVFTGKVIGAYPDQGNVIYMIANDDAAIDAVYVGADKVQFGIDDVVTVAGILKRFDGGDPCIKIDAITKGEIISYE